MTGLIAAALLLLPAAAAPQALAQAQEANVVAYGADPTGAVSSASAFAKALASSESVFVPAGTYDLGASTLLVPSRKTLHGVGQGTILRFSGATVGLAIGAGSALS